MRRTLLSLATLALAGGFVTSLKAQGDDGRRGLVPVSDNSLRTGIYFAVGLGAGSEQCKFSDTPCSILNPDGSMQPATGTWRSAITSPAFLLRVGGTMNQSFRLGGELMGWSGDNGPSTEHMTALLLTGQFYPTARSGFYLKGGVGYAWDWDDFNDGSFTDTENGFAFNLGAGYEFPLNRHVAIAPDVDLFQGSFPSAGQPTLTDRVLFFGITLTFQSNGRWR